MSSPTGRFQPADRLLRSSEFESVLRTGQRRVVGKLVLMTAPGPPKATRRRLGITVSKRVGNSVVRNHVKRRVREWFRSSREQLPAGTDLVVIGRRGAGELSGREVSRLLDAAVARQGRAAG